MFYYIIAKTRFIHKSYACGVLIATSGAAIASSAPLEAVSVLKVEPKDEIILP
jgi:hypothetical protein